MKERKIGLFFLLVFLLAIYLPLMAYAQGCLKGAQQKCGLEKKMSCTLHCIMANQDELGLTDEQGEKIQQLKTSSQKDLIKLEAEIDLITIDIKSKSREDKIDKEGIGELIDRKYDLKKEKAKALIGAYADLRNILSIEQTKKLSQLKCPKGQCPKGQCPKRNTQGPDPRPKCGMK